MLDEVTLEHRLATLEREVAALKHKSDNNTGSDNWLDQLVGSISDESVFLEALEYGRTLRQSDRPIDESDDQA